MAIKLSDVRAGHLFRSIQTNNIVEIDLFIMGEFRDDETYMDHLMPIKITKEILATCGFTPDYEGSEYSFSRSLPIGNGSDIGLSYSPLDEEWETTLDTESRAFYPENIQYVHQLQILYFSIVHKEIEIDREQFNKIMNGKGK